MAASSTSRQQRLLYVTTGFALATVVLGGIGIGLETEFEEVTTWSERWTTWTTLAFDAVGLLAFAQPDPSPQNVWFGSAQVTTILFAIFATGTAVFTLSGTVRKTWMLRVVKRASNRAPSEAHAIVVGRSSTARQLVADLSAKGRNVIVIAEDASARDRKAFRRQGALVLPRDPRKRRTWTQAHVSIAGEVFLVDDNDAVNLEIAEDVTRGFPWVEGGPPYFRRDARLPRLDVYVQVQDPAYAALFRERDFFRSEKQDATVYVFDVRERAARDLLLHPEHGLATTHAPGRRDVAHYVVVGFGETGQAVALEAARLGHFENERRLRMTVVDDFRENDGTVGPADEARRQFLARVPTFCPDDLDLSVHARKADAAKDDWSSRDYRPACKGVRRDAPAIEYVANAEFVDLPADDPDLVEHLIERFTVPDDATVRPAFVVCFDDEGRNFRTAHRLQTLLRSRRVHDAVGDVPIYVYVPAEEGLERLLRAGSGDDEPIPMYPFGRRSRVTSHAQITRPKILDLAKSINEGYARKYALGNGELPSRNELWRDLSTAFRFSNEDAAAHAVVKLRTAGYRWRVFDDGADPDATIPATEIEVSRSEIQTLSRMEHNRFVAERLLSGWTYEALPDGYDAMTSDQRKQVKNEMKTRRRRSSIAPFDALHPEDTPKDEEQVNVVLDALARTGERVEVVGT